MQVRANSRHQGVSEALDQVFRLIKEGDFSGALDHVLNINPHYITGPEQLERYHYARARCCYGNDLYQEAIQYYMRIPQWSLKPEVLNGMGYCFQHLGWQFCARRVFQREEDLRLNEIGKQHLAAGSYGKALRAFRVMHDAGTSSAALLGTAQALEGLGACQQASQAYADLQARWPEAAEQHFQARRAREDACKSRITALYPRFYDLRLQSRGAESQALNALDLARPGPAKRGNF